MPHNQQNNQQQQNRPWNRGGGMNMRGRPRGRGGPPHQVNILTKIIDYIKADLFYFIFLSVV